MLRQRRGVPRHRLQRSRRHVRKSDTRPSLENSPIRPDAHGAHPYVQIGEAYGKEAAPGEDHVAAIEAAHAIVGLFASGPAGELIEESAYQVTERVAAERVTTEENHIREKNQSADADAKGFAGARREPESQPDIVREEDEKDERQI